MAETYYTVPQALAAVRAAEAILRRNEAELEDCRRRERAAAPGSWEKDHWRGAAKVQARFVETLKDRWEYLRGELEKALENERLGIPPLGPKETTPWARRD